MRGAVSIALAYNQVYVVVIWARGTNINLFNMHACFQFTFSGVTVDPVHAAIITSTIVVVFFTTLVSISPGPARPRNIRNEIFLRVKGFGNLETFRKKKPGN
jgi:hypothetical protein